MTSKSLRIGSSLLGVLLLVAIPDASLAQTTPAAMAGQEAGPAEDSHDVLTNGDILKGSVAEALPASGSQAPVTTSLGAESKASDDEGHLFRRTIAPATLITLGLFAFKDEGFFNRESVRQWRNEFIPEFEDHTDDYGQFAAGALALGLNAFGVKGEHELGRATVTYATSFGVMMIGIHSIKNLADVKRPNGSNNHSFPSGHTAASFASARFLDREYGQVSYLYSLGGYGIAAMTGVYRQLNNAHWLSDVLVGAGIGILSTDIAYALMDELYGEKGMVPPRPISSPKPRGNPSFLDFRLAYAGHTGDVEDPEGPFHIGGGWSSGFEGAWFFHPNVGVGGESSVAAFPITTDNFLVGDPDLDAVIEELVTQPLGSWSLYAGPFFDLALSDRWALTGKLTAGIALGATGTISAKIVEEAQEEVGSAEVPILQYDPSDSFGFAAGVGIRTMVSERIGIRVFGEWNYSQPDYEIREITSVNPDGSLVTGEVVTRESVDFSYFSFGASVSALLW